MSQVHSGGEGAQPDYDVFISYRRNQNFAASVFESEFKRYGVACFRDDGGIRAGADWRDKIDQSLRSCHVVVVLMTSNFMSLAERGLRRLEEPGDMVAHEIRTALDLEEKGYLTVIPVLLCDAVMPDRGALMQDLKRLARNNGRPVHNPEHRSDVQSVVVDVIKEILARGGQLPRSTVLRENLLEAGLGSPVAAAPFPPRATQGAGRPAGPGQHEPSGPVPTLPPPVSRRSGAGIVGVLWHRKGNRFVRIDERKALIEDEHGVVVSQRTLPFRPLSGVVTDDGNYLVFATENELLLASVLSDRINFEEQGAVKMEGTIRVLSAWRSGAFVNVIRSTNSGTGRCRLAIGSDVASLVLASDPPPGPDLWSAAVQSGSGFASISTEGSVSMQGPLALALGDTARHGWCSLDLARGVDGPREWMIGLREGDNIHELVITSMNELRWSAMRTVQIPPAERVLLSHPFASTAPSLHLQIDGEICSWRLTDLGSVKP